MSTDKWIDKEDPQIDEQIHNGLLPRHKKEWNIALYDKQHGVPRGYLLSEIQKTNKWINETK